MSLTLERIEPGNLAQVWDLISPGIEQCVTHDSDRPRLEEVYAAIRNGGAQLFVGYVLRNYAGFVVTTSHRTPWTQTPFLFLWLVHNTTGHDVLREGQMQLEKMAKDAGYAFLRLRSDRFAFERLCRDMGYTLEAIELQKGL